MGTTVLAGLSYPELNDAPNVPRDVKELADDCDRELYRAYPCTSTTRPAPDRAGRICRESDTGRLYVATGTAWVLFADPGGGAGGASSSYGSWRHTLAQSVGGSNTILAVNTEDAASAIIPRTTSGVGHKFTLNEAGIYSISASVLFGAGAGGARYLQLTDPAITLAYDTMTVPVPTQTANDITLKIAVIRHFNASTPVVLVGAQTGQSTLGVQVLHLDIVKIAA